MSSEPEVPADEAPAAPAVDARPRQVRAWVVWVVAAVIALVVGTAGGWLGSTIGTSRASAGTASGSAAGFCDAAAVARRALPSVVTVNVPGSVGSGFFVRDDGHIVTNNHVISSAASGGAITVTLSDGVTQTATLVGRDPASDLAVLKVTGTGRPVIAPFDSDAVVVGQPVVALGAPLGLSSSVTAGIVSALGRNVPVPGDNGRPAVIVGGIQTDASINPGNSGGALVDCRGRLIGVNTAIATVPNAEGTTGGGSVGIGFAVPSNRALRIADDLIAHGSVVYPDFGATVTPLPPSASKQTGGLYVQAVTPGGSAATAGLRAGDVITEINGRPAARTDVLGEFLLTSRAGDTVRVTYLRDAAPHQATVTLQPGTR